MIVNITMRRRTKMLYQLFKYAVLDFDGVMSNESTWSVFNKEIEKLDKALYSKIKRINKKYAKKFGSLSSSEYFRWFDIVINMYKKITDLNTIIDCAAKNLGQMPGAIEFMHNFNEKNLCIISCGIGEVIERFLVHNHYDKKIKIYANYITTDYNENSLIYGTNKGYFLNNFIEKNDINQKKTIVVGDSPCDVASIFLPDTTNCFVVSDKTFDQNFDQSKVDLFIGSLEDLMIMYK